MRFLLPSAAHHCDSERRAKRRREIIEAAARAFARAGYDSTEMESVAAELAVAKGTLYLYFPSKQDLFFACVDEGMRQMQCNVSAARDAEGDPFDRIAQAIRAYLTFYDEHPHFAELMIQERAIFKDRKKSTYFEHRAANRSAWRALYQELIDAGRVRGDLPLEQMLETIGSLLYGTMFTNHFAGRSVSIEEQFQTLFAILLGGIVTPEERSRRRSAPAAESSSRSPRRKPRRTKSRP